ELRRHKWARHPARVMPGFVPRVLWHAGTPPENGGHREYAGSRGQPPTARALRRSMPDETGMRRARVPAGRVLLLPPAALRLYLWRTRVSSVSRCPDTPLPRAKPLPVSECGRADDAGLLLSFRCPHPAHVTDLFAPPDGSGSEASVCT